jgi:hypothetical protein
MACQKSDQINKSSSKTEMAGNLPRRSLVSSLLCLVKLTRLTTISYVEYLSILQIISAKKTVSCAVVKKEHKALHKCWS